MRLVRVLPAVLLICLFAFSFVVPASLNAQTTAAIDGSLTDPNGAFVSDAEVTARLLESSKQSYQATSGEDGQFHLTLPPGRYRLSITRQSFEPLLQEIALNAGETRRLDLRLQLAPLASSVVVSASAEPSLIASTAAPVTILTQEDISQRNAIFLASLLSTTPGISTYSEGPFGGITSLFLDGGESDFTKVLIDGTPVNDPGGALDWSNYELSNIDKIEIVHGASSALYGSDSNTGVIQIFTHRGSTRIPEFDLFSEGGTFGTGLGDARLSGLLGKFDYSGSVSYFSTNGQGPNDRFRDTTLSGNFGYRFSDTDSVRLTVRSLASDAGEAGQTLLLPANLVQNDDLKSDFLNLSWDFMTGSHWQHHLAGIEADIREIYTDPGSYIDINQYNRAGFEEQSSYLFPKGVASLGYNYEVENGSANGPHERRNNQGGYLEVRYQFAQRWSASAGTRAEDNASFGTRVVPRAGLVYSARTGSNFWGATRLRASYGDGIKEPSFVESFENDPCDPGNPNLQPERSGTFSAGIDQSIDSDRLKFSATYFHNSFYDIVSFYSGGPLTAACPFGTGTFYNTDKERAYGGEGSFEAKPLRWLFLMGNYTYDNSRVLEAPNYYDPTQAPGNRLLLRPLNSANIVANASFRRMDWNVVGTYVGRRTDSDFLGFGYTSVASYVRWDIATNYRVSNNFTFTGRVQNIFDRRYQEAVGYPALGLNYLLGLRFRWGGEK